MDINGIALLICLFWLIALGGMMRKAKNEATEYPSDFREDWEYKHKPHDNSRGR